MNNQNLPLVSILIPVFGVEKYIEKSVISLMEQTYTNIEYVFVDDCTMDNSIQIINEVINKYPERNKCVQILKHERNRGLSAARNTALMYSHGDFIMHVDSDDYVEKEYVEKCIKKAIESDAEIVTVARNFVYKNKIKLIVPKNCDSIIEWKKNILRGSFPHTVWGSLIKKSLYTDHNIFAVEGLHQGEDFAVMCRLAYYVKKVAVIDVPLYNYVIRTGIYNYKEKIVEDTYRSWFIVNEFYKEKEDYYLYSDILNRRIMSFCAWQIMCWQLACPENTEAPLLIRKTFPKIEDMKGLPIRKRVMLNLFYEEKYSLLRLFILFSRYFQLLINRRGTEF